jgi:hypothetical protein
MDCGGGGNEERRYSYMKSVIKGYEREKRLGYTILKQSWKAMLKSLLPLDHFGYENYQTNVYLFI